MNKFLKNVLFVLSGTAGAQAIGFITIPIITRQYGPEAFGILGFVMAITNILNPISALTLPSSIVLANERDIDNISDLSKFLSAILMAFVLIASAGYIELYNEEGEYLYLIFATVFFSTIYQIEQNKMVRDGRFEVISKSSVLSSLFLNMIKVLFAFIYPEAIILVLISIFTPLVQTMFIAGSVRRAFIKFKIFKDNISFEILKRYRDFPIYKCPQVLLNATTQSLPVIILASKFGVIYSGYYSLSRMVIGVPINLLNKSVGDVFYSRVSRIKRENKRIFPELRNITLILFLLMVVPFSIFSQMSSEIFILIFGQEWEIAGDYAGWMSIWLLFALINRPSVVTIQVLSLQKYYLYYEAITMIVRVSVFYYVAVTFQDPFLAVKFFSIISCVVNLLLISWVFYKAINNDNCYVESMV